MKNRHNSTRVDFVKIAQLVTADGTIVLDCKVRNLTSSGARLVVTDDADLPERVVLHLPLDSVSWTCRIVRRRGNILGVQFT